MSQIKLRRGTTAQWAAADPILGDGEQGLDTTLSLLKIGNGVDAWSALPWAEALASDVYAWAKAATKPSYTAAEVGAATNLVAITHTPATTFAIPNPGAGTYAGQKVLYHIKPTAAINLTNANAHLLATDSLVTFPKALAANKTYIVQLMWNGSAWMLVTLVGGY